MKGWRGLALAALLGVALAVGCQPVAHDPAPVEIPADYQLPTLAVLP